MRGAGILLAAFALASCAFGSEEPLFGAEDAVAPFADGAAFHWLPHPDDERLIVRFSRVGNGYEVIPVNRPDERPMRILFVSIVETHEDDYIGQIELEADGRGRAYAFLWPMGDDRYRIVYEPRAFAENGENAAPQLCAPASYGGCTFHSAEDVRAYYRNVLYPAFRSGQTPERYLDMISADAEAMPQPAPPGKPTRK
jgi:hypothetical protein